MAERPTPESAADPTPASCPPHLDASPELPPELPPDSPLNSVPASKSILSNRVVAGIVFMGCIGILSIARYLTPASEGMGTHTQLGLPDCSFKIMSGLPCLTCGMTTSFSHAAHGRLDRAAVAQPAGAVLALGTAMLALVSGIAIFTGAAIGPLTQWLWRPMPLIVLITLLALAWMYKIVQVTQAVA